MSKQEQLYVGQVDHLKRDIAGNLLRLIDLEVTGYKNLTLFNGPAIFDIFPHTSHIDSWAIRDALPQELKHLLVFLAKKEYWDGWRRPIGELTNALILIPTAKGTSPRNAIRTAAHCMNQGYSIGISAEGTRTLDPIDKRRFEDGIGTLLKFAHFKPPLVPVLLQGFGKVWPKDQNLPHTIEQGGILFQRKQVYVHFGMPKFYNEKDFVDRNDLVEDFRQHCIQQFMDKFKELDCK